MRLNRLTFFFLFFAFGLEAQESLSLENAIAIALERNYNVRIAQNDAAISHLNNTRANAGLLPSVSLNAGDNASAVNFRQKLANGTEINRPLGLFNSFFTSLNANWTLYDGHRAYMEKERLDALDGQGRELLKAQMEATTTAVALAWFQVARQQETLLNLEEVIVTFQERLNLATHRLEFGLGNKIDMLQAQIDLNERLKQKTLAENDLAEAKRNLNGLLTRNPEINFIPGKLPADVPTPPDTAVLKQQIFDDNPSVGSLERALQAAQLAEMQAKNLGKPRIGLAGSYSFQRSDNTTGFSLFTMQHGPALGVNFTMPVFTGGNLKRQAETNKLTVQSATLRLEQLQQGLLVQMYNLNGRIASLRLALIVDNQTLVLARENQMIAAERFRLGQSTALEVREAQLSLENALFRANQTRFDLWITDVLLKAL
jgi:outer membrane protein